MCVIEASSQRHGLGSASEKGRLSLRARPALRRVQMHAQHSSDASESFNVAGKKYLAAGLLSMSLLCSSSSPAEANEKIAEFRSSGFLFKDTVTVVSLKDPQVDGIVIYYTDYNRSLQEKLSNDPFGDPSQSSISCVPTGQHISIKNPDAIRSSEGKEIFSEGKTFNILQNKKTRIRRIYDEKDQNLIYIAYSTRNTSSSDEGGVSSSRYRTSMCAVHADDIQSTDTTQ